MKILLNQYPKTYVRTQSRDLCVNVSEDVRMTSSPSRSIPRAALQTTKALSLDKSDTLSQSVSLTNSTGSAGSTLTLEHLRLDPARLLTPPWSTEDTPTCSQASHALVQSPGWSSVDTDSVGLQIGRAHV